MSRTIRSLAERHAAHKVLRNVLTDPQATGFERAVATLLAMNVAPEPCPHCGDTIGLRGWAAHVRACETRMKGGDRMADEKERTDEDQPEKPAEDEKAAEEEAQAP